jgi:DNA topoisomerase I
MICFDSQNVTPAQPGNLSGTMTLKLLIVESPAKCKKIAGFLGAGWRVQATMGHIRALKEDLDAIGFRKTWRPTYENIATKRDAIASLRKAAAGAQVYLGADDDREGEAIAWHTCAILGLDPATTPRVVFHEITEPALKAAVAAPRTIDMNKFNAQQARTMLDMLIGFTLSPCLWRGVGFKPGLSAGRCQTPALRIIYDRDTAIEAHTASTSWRIEAVTPTGEDSLRWRATADAQNDTQAFTSGSAATGGVSDGEARALDVLKQLPAAPQTLTVAARTERVSTSQPPKPFITSSLQQEASSRLSMNPKVTMRAAQTLYEAGHITYMRTDNAILSQEAIDAASAIVKARWGDAYLGGVAVATDAAPAKKKIVKKKAAAAAPTAPEAQAAHEGIRPTHMEIDNGDQLEGMGSNERRLYNLIWQRTIQSVMAPEQRDVVKLTGHPTPKPALLSLETTWDQTRFAGYRILEAERKEEEEAAAAATFEARKGLTEGATLPWSAFTATEIRSAPPARYTEAALIRELESRGIGRPSTYATLVETVMERGYVEKATIAAAPVQLRGLELKAGAKIPKQTTRTEKAGGEKDKLRTTPLGRTVIEWLLTNFGDMIEYDFTAAMEAQLDEVAKGSRQWDSVLKNTWARYEDRYDAVMAAPKADATPGTAAQPTRSANKADFGDGYKLVVSKKGPLFVLERDGEKTRFATVPQNLSVQTATRADAEAAFAAATAAAGEDLGELDGIAVIRKKGPYGTYVQWGTHRLTCKPEETLDDLEERLRAKAAPADTVDHTVGPYKIKRGPYGLYMFKQTTGTKKPTFVSIPAETPWATLTPETAEQVYKLAMESKKAAAPAKKKKKE